MAGQFKLGIVAAMEREIKPLVRGWKTATVRASDGESKVFLQGETVLACAGIGDAGPTTRRLLANYDPEIVMSVGFAGSLTESLQVPAVFVPELVVDDETGVEFHTGVGSGSLVTAGQIADVREKQKLAARYSAQAVDMEASQVAQSAKLAKRRFLAIKVISDDAGSDISFVSDFVHGRGFDTAGFLAHVAIRPRLWGAVRTIQINSNRAQQALCSYLEFIIQNTSQLDTALTSTDAFRAVSQAK